MPDIPVNTEPMAVSAAMAAQLLGVSRPVIYRLMHEKGLPHFKIGTRTLIPTDGLRNWVAQQSRNGGV